MKALLGNRIYLKQLFFLTPRCLKSTSIQILVLLLSTRIYERGVCCLNDWDCVCTHCQITAHKKINWTFACSLQLGFSQEKHSFCNEEIESNTMKSSLN